MDLLAITDSTVSAENVSRIIAEMQRLSEMQTPSELELPARVLRDYTIDIELEQHNPITCFTEFFCSLDLDSLRALSYRTVGLFVRLQMCGLTEYIDAIRTARNSALIKHYLV